jgi:hypothetical protein
MTTQVEYGRIVREFRAYCIGIEAMTKEQLPCEQMHGIGVRVQSVMRFIDHCIECEASLRRGLKFRLQPLLGLYNIVRLSGEENPLRDTENDDLELMKLKALSQINKMDRMRHGVTLRIIGVALNEVDDLLRGFNTWTDGMIDLCPHDDDVIELGTIDSRIMVLEHDIREALDVDF